MGGGDRMRGILTQIEDEMHERLILELSICKSRDVNFFGSISVSGYLPLP